MGRDALGRVVVTGGTGLVGRRLVEALLRRKVSVSVVSRDPAQASLPPGVEAFPWHELPAGLEGADAIFNLAGAGLADRRWTSRRKEELLRSRTENTRRLVEALSRTARRPAVLVNASAVGFYGNRGRAILDEGSAPGQGFLPEVCLEWEREAETVKPLGVRLVKVRLGVVLAREGGALPRMALPVRLFLGCSIGGGRQGLSWIHIGDLVNLLLEAAANQAYEGAVNATSPRPLTHRAFMRLLAHRLRRPLWPVPSFLTRTASLALLGEMARPLLLEGAYVYPRKALALGFKFAFERPEEALEDLL